MQQTNNKQFNSVKIRNKDRRTKSPQSQLHGEVMASGSPVFVLKNKTI